MVIRLRIYESQRANHVEADRVFYDLVKPVHERYGAIFMGRYRDRENRVHVLWRYQSQDEMNRIQEAVSKDPVSLENKKERQSNGLHGLEYQEYILVPTGPI